MARRARRSFAGRRLEFLPLASIPYNARALNKPSFFSLRGRQVLFVALLLVGALGWWMLFGAHWQVFLTIGSWGPAALLLAVAIAAALCALGPVRAAFATRPAASTGWSVAAAILGGAYLLLTAWRQERQLFPYVHDEFSYLIQAHQFARGRLWMPPHPLAPFFDSFQLLVDSVYASAYFPGTALLHVPGVWLGLPPWATTIAVAAAVAGLLHWIVSRMVDPVAGWMAWILLLSCQLFRTFSTVTTAWIPLLLYALIACVAWMKWRESGQRRWAIGIGAFVGLACVTRPVDALCYAMPLGLAVLLDLRRKAKKLRPLVWLTLGLSPWLALQLVIDHGITGHLFTTPFRLYADRDHPNTAYGTFRFDENARPVSDLPQKLALYRQYSSEFAARRARGVAHDLVGYRIPLTIGLASSTPFPLLACLLPLSLVALNRHRWVLWTALPMFLVLYIAYVFFFPAYALATAPAVVLAPIIVARAAALRGVGSWLSLMIVMLAIAALPELDLSVRDDVFDAPLIREVNRQLAAIDRPAVVLFRFSPQRNVHEEPVYNADTAWPDDARIIRAHDRRAENVAIFRYYAQRQPDRAFYLFDEGSNALSYLGPAGQLARVSP